MKRLVILATALAACATARAAEPAPTVALTQDELRLVISAEVAKAITQGEAAKAKGAYEKIQAAFAPKPAEPPKAEFAPSGAPTK